MKRIHTIQQFAIAAILAICGTVGVHAQESDLKTLQTRQDSQGWEAVGRLDIRGKGFCTAALIRDRLILTAAHCLYDVDGSVIAADRFSFLAGLRDGQAQASRAERGLSPIQIMITTGTLPTHQRLHWISLCSNLTAQSEIPVFYLIKLHSGQSPATRLA